MITNKKPGIYIPTLYFAEGLPYTVVMMMSGVFFKSLGASNIFIGLTSVLSLPWILKFLWAPLVDFYGTKRSWIIFAQLALAVVIAGTAGIAFISGNLPFDMFIAAAVTTLALTALASATQDVAIDGYYLEALNEEQKAFFVGVRNAFYKVAWLFGSGGLVYLAGELGKTSGIGFGWGASFGVCALCMLIASAFHAFYLPKVEKSGKERAAERTIPSRGPDFWRAISTYFQQPGIIAIVAYILIFRFGDALMLKQAPNFLLDPADKGGLALTVSDIGIINGTVGMIFLLIGGIVGSWIISKGGLKRWLWPTALIQNGAILLYWALAVMRPSIEWVYVVNSIEQFSYGLGTAAYTVFLLSTVKTEHKAAHYATATALMALGLLVPQTLSGYLTAIGYANFFMVSFLTSIPGIIAIFFLPIWRQEDPVVAATTPEPEVTQAK